MKHASLARVALLVALIIALIVALVAGLALDFANREQFSPGALQAWLAFAGGWAPVFFITIYALGTALMFLPRLMRQFNAGLIITPAMLHALPAESGTGGNIIAENTLGHHHA